MTTQAGLHDSCLYNGEWDELAVSNLWHTLQFAVGYGTTIPMNEPELSQALAE